MSDYGEIDDGFGNVWTLCKPGCQLEIVRPGKVQCDCDYQREDDGQICSDCPGSAVPTCCLAKYAMDEDAHRDRC